MDFYLNDFSDLFDLNDELLDQIIFAMEDQQHQFLINCMTGELVQADELEQGSGYIQVPDWKPIDGFYLMEKFISQLRNPIFREQLKEALSSGKGVFRNFKDILKRNKEIERHWHIFKDREMRQIVWLWYNDQRELAGLERLIPAPEETGDLLLSDFTISKGDNEHLENALRLDRKVFFEAYPDADKAGIERLYSQKREHVPGVFDTESLFIVVETPAGEFAGFAWGVERIDPANENTGLMLLQVAVVKHYRGLGLGSLLLKNVLQTAHERGYEFLNIELSGDSLSFSDYLQSLGFNVIKQTLGFNLSDWEADL